MPPIRVTTTACAACSLVLTLALAGCGSSSSKPNAQTLEVTLTDAGCTPTKLAARSGPVTIHVQNGGTSKVSELELKSSSGIILGERENIVSGIDGSFTLNLQPGSYTLSCPNGDREDNSRLVVSGKATAVPAADAAALAAATAGYKSYVEGESVKLVTATREFAAALQSGNLARAKALFGPTRSHYEAIEPVAESFPGLDSAIDARIDSPTVAGNVSKWTGFHRIEQYMWAKNTLVGVTPLANQLLANVQTLNDKVPTLPLAATQLINGSVELLNEITNVKITGEEDRYSHTDLSDFQGNLTGARKAFEYVRPALEQHGGDTAVYGRIASQLQSVQDTLNHYRRKTPLGFALYGALTETDKRSLAKRVGEAAQDLSTVAQKLAGG
jgi:iron uptake system component EfeO